jgi:hypothetical protein
MYKDVYTYRTPEVMSGLAGAFYGIQHLVHTLEKANTSCMRDGTLSLLHVLLTDTANAWEFVRVGGAQLLVRIAASIHSERLASKGTTSSDLLLEAGTQSFEDDGSKYRVWICAEKKEQRMLLQDIGEHGVLYVYILCICHVYGGSRYSV